MLSKSAVTIVARQKYPALLLASAANLLLLQAPVHAQTIGQADSETPDETGESDVIVVSGARYGYQPIEVKEVSPYIVDSVSYDDVEAPTGDNSIASMVQNVPGVSFEGDGDEPRYITIRGLSADLNVTTIDGLTLATTGENGSGTRRVNLQLVPADISERVDVFKAFTAEHDSSAIGGLTDIVTRSAFGNSGQSLMLDVYGIYSTFEGPAGENSAEADSAHWGKGLKAAFAQRFGADEQFGVVFTGRYQDRVRNSSKNWPDQRVFFNRAGDVISAPDPELDWDGTQAMAKFAWGDYSNEITNLGGSLKLEWQPTLGANAFVMGYSYNRKEASTMNSTDVIGIPKTISDRTETTGNSQVNYVQSVVRYNQWDRTGTGVIGGFDLELGELSEISLRGGYTREGFEDDEYWTRVRTDGGNGMAFDYDSSGFPQMTAFYGDPFASTYLLNGSNINWISANEGVVDLRADYAFNTRPGDRGFGFKIGAKWTRLEIEKDVDSERYVTGGNANDLLYDPGYSHYGSNGFVTPWIDYDRYWNGGTPSVNGEASEYYSKITDYEYQEEIANAYLHLQYSTESTTLIGGLRYDHATYEGRAPLTIDGTLTDDFSRPSGDYTYWLPSLNVVHELDDQWKIRGSISRSIGRPAPGQIVQAESQTCGEEVTGCTITRGNPDLKPRKANNYDLAVEHYFNGGDGLIALTAFRKEIEDDIFTLTTDIEADGLLNRIRQPLNAETSKVQGLELALVNRSFGFAENLGASFNITAMSGEMNYTTDSVERSIDRILVQPDWMANLTMTYRLPSIDGAVRITANYQDDYLNGIGGDEWADRFQNGRTNVDLSFWHGVWKDVMFKYEIDNLLNVEPELYHGRNVGDSLSQRDEYGQGIYFHIIYAPGR